MEKELENLKEKEKKSSQKKKEFEVIKADIQRLQG